MLAKQVIIPVLLSSFLIGCGPKEDPDVAKKLEETREEVATMEDEISSMEEEIKRIRMNDPSDQLVGLKKEFKKIEEDQTALEAQVVEIEEARKEAAKSFESYRAKYPLPSEQ